MKCARFAACIAALFLSLGLSLSCLDATPDVVVTASETTSSAYGQSGPYGVGRFERVVRVRVDQSVDVEVTVPLDASGNIVPGPHPVGLLIHGGAVAPQRYRWLMNHLTTRGLVMIAPPHALNLALFQSGNGLDVLESLRLAAANESDPLHGLMSANGGLVIGHSLGGVVAAKSWLNGTGSVTHLVLLAGIPDPADDFSRSTLGSSNTRGSRILSITGSEDGRIAPDAVRDGLLQLEKARVPLTMAVVDGMNHMQFVDEVTPEDEANDKPATISVEEARSRALFLIDAVVDDLARSQGADLLQDTSRWPEGVLSYSEWEASK